MLVVLLSVAATVVYGIVMDQITVRVCIEYFTIGHPYLVDPSSPTLLALAWGVVATWWVGLLLGIPLALCARVGSWPKTFAKDLLRPIAILMVAVGVLALIAGIVGYVLARAGGVWLVGRFAEAVPRERQAPFLADLWAHTASYGFGALGGISLWIWTIMQRGRRVVNRAAAPPP